MSIQTSPLNFRQLINLYGITRNELHEKILNKFHLKLNEFPALEFYKLLHFTGAQFKAKIFQGTIPYIHPDNSTTNCSIIYQGVDKNNKPANYLSACNAIEIRISFRAARKEYNLPAYAIVQIVA